MDGLDQLSELIIYIDRSVIQPGGLDELRAGISALVKFIQDREPQLLAYGFYFDEDTERMTVVAIHPDAASLERHLAIGGSEFRKLAHLIDLQRIEVYGRPSKAAMKELRQKARDLGDRGDVRVYSLHQGFARVGQSSQP
jgi:hypothetical protein